MKQKKNDVLTMALTAIWIALFILAVILELTKHSALSLAIALPMLTLAILDLILSYRNVRMAKREYMNNISESFEALKAIHKLRYSLYFEQGKEKEIAKSTKSIERHALNLLAYLEFAQNNPKFSKKDRRKCKEIEDQVKYLLLETKPMNESY